MKPSLPLSLLCLSIRAFLPACCGLCLASGLTSCASNEQLQERLDRRTDAAVKYQERRKMRNEANDVRYNAWYDRVMN
jgi:hypothetical protein